MSNQPLALPDVTIVILDNKEIALAMLALQKTLRHITPGAIHIYTDDRWTDDNYSAPTTIFRRDFKSLREVEQCIWTEVGPQLTTSHMLMIQWDGWVIDASAWNPKFLKYDYIGAIWPWYMVNKNGNGGFSLRSKALMSRMWAFELDGPEDSCLCRRYRARLETMGYKWAPDSLAREFSYEREVKKDTFGFHGAFNLAYVMGYQDMAEYIALATDYALSKAEWAQMLEAAHA